MKKRLFLLLALAGTFYSGQIMSQEATGPLAIKLGTRINYQREYLDGDDVRENNGFRGQYLFLDIFGNIGKRFSYSYRQRLNELHDNKDFFDGTDFLNLQYKINSKWDITAGKMALNVGSWEYDRNPMYVYHFSEWLNQISCFKFGATLGFNVTANDRLTAQFAESPFNNRNDLYSYSIGWSGNHGLLSTIYTANMMEYRPGKFIYYLCLGNKLNLGKVQLEVDYVNRATGNHAFFFKDCTLVGELSYAPTKHWNLIAKGSYEVNNTDDSADMLIHAGTEISQVAGGAEFFPLKDGNKDLRFHLHCGYSFGTNTNPNAVMKDKQLTAAIGVQFYMDLVDLAKQIWKKSK